MKKFIMITASMLISLTLLTSCSVTIKGPEILINRMGIELPISSRVIQSDSHDKFFGEGELYEVYKLEEYIGDHVVKEINGNQNWQPLPIDEFISSLINDTDDIVSYPSTAQSIENQEIVLPKTDWGYYCFYDKRSKSYYPENFASSYNYLDYSFSIAILDMHNYNFYYLEMDR